MMKLVSLLCGTFTIDQLLIVHLHLLNLNSCEKLTIALFFISAKTSLASLISQSDAFAPSTLFRRGSTSLSVALGEEVDFIGNNIAVKDLLQKVESTKLLSKVAASGLLSKAQASGITLSKLEPLLAQAAEYPEILILVEASGPELLPILPKIVELAPGALPLLASAISIPTPIIGFAGVVALGAAIGAVVLIPDDTVINVAAQSLTVGLALPLAGASFAGAAILGKLK
jgi:Protein of unknown function (DUF1118)